MRATDQIKHFTLAFAFVLAMASFSQPAFGADTQSPSADTQSPSAESQQEVQARAASLQTWREQCSDPDPDLRLAYVESAIANKDASVQRICIRLALQSDNSDIRNLGLRAAIAATQQITFMPTMPKSLEAELRKGADDENFMRKVKETYASRVYETTQNGLKMCSDKVEIGKNSFLWNTLAANVELRKDGFTKATITGSKISWTGYVNISSLGTISCSVNVALTREGKLAGKLLCDKTPPIDIIADLL